MGMVESLQMGRDITGSNNPEVVGRKRIKEKKRSG